jgi:hypothetical protein
MFFQKLLYKAKPAETVDLDFAPLDGVRSVEEFLSCGRLQEGFARIRCTKCHKERSWTPIVFLFKQWVSRIPVAPDIADGLRLIREVAQEAPELQLIQSEILIKKTWRCACAITL